MTENQIVTTDRPDLEANDLVLAKEVADALHQHYPNHFWAVQVEGKQGVIYVRNLSLSGSWGYVIKLGPIYSASELRRQIMRAGGELLERYRVARARADHEALVHLPTDFAGRHIAQI